MDKAICGSFYYNYLQAGTAAPTPQTRDWLPCQRRARPLPNLQTDKGAPPPSSFIIHASSFPKVPPPTTPVSPCIGGQNLSPAPFLKCLHRVTPILEETAEPSLSKSQTSPAPVGDFFCSRTLSHPFACFAGCYLPFSPFNFLRFGASLRDFSSWAALLQTYQSAMCPSHP